MTITRFEDIEAWKQARELSRQIYQTSSSGDFSRDFALRNQIRSAAVSVMSNIAEGFERDGNKEFVQFLSIAKGSCGEVKSQLYVAMDNGFINEKQFKNLLVIAEETSRLTAGFMRYLQNSDLRGRKTATRNLSQPGTRNPKPGTY